jgi:hypothetical protein
MATQRQIVANQRNALLSTGPQSEAGKARSRLNAVKHGLTAQQVLVAGESQEHYDQLRQAVFEELMPDGVIASQLADRVVTLLWRMRRIPAFEAALLEWGAYMSEPGVDNGERQLQLGAALHEMMSRDYTGKLGRYETSLQTQLSEPLRAFGEFTAARPIDASTQLPSES